MRPFFLLIVLIISTFAAQLFASPDHRSDSLDKLQRELVSMFKQREIAEFPNPSTHEITVGFLINARNEVIVLDISGDNKAACDYVKKIINYKKVKFNPSRQLTRYSIKIFLVNDMI